MLMNFNKDMKEGDSYKGIQEKIDDLIEELDSLRKREQQLLKVLRKLQQKQWDRAGRVTDQYGTLLKKESFRHARFRDDAKDEIEKAE